MLLSLALERVGGGCGEADAVTSRSHSMVHSISAVSKADLWQENHLGESLKRWLCLHLPLRSEALLLQDQEGPIAFLNS